MAFWLGYSDQNAMITEGCGPYLVTTNFFLAEVTGS